MKKTIIYSALAAVVSLAFVACDIERIPETSMSAESISSDPLSQLPSLMNGTYGQLKSWSDPMHRCGEYAGDNIAIRGSSTDAFFEFISYSRTADNYRLQNFWDYGYKAIAQASNILAMIDEDGADEETLNSLGECYFIRGLCYFYFVRAYGRPFYDNPDRANGGVPIVNGTPDDMLNLELPDRSTVREVYAQVISDFEKAIELMTIDDGAAYASKGAAQALLSRVYLYMSGTYESPNTDYAKLASDYATAVIESGDFSLLSRADFMSYPSYTPESNPETIFAVKRVSTEYSGYDHYYGIGGMYSNIGGMGWGEMYASETYLQLLAETGRNDWRTSEFSDARAAFIEPTYENEDDYFRFVAKVYEQDADGNPTDVQSGYLYYQLPVTYSGSNVIATNGDDTYTLTAINADEETYSIVFGGETYEGCIDWYITYNRNNPQFYIVKCSREGEESQLHSPVISRLGEIYLNRAEAYAKQGKYTEALADLNTIRERSIIGGGYASLTSANAKELIDKERQLELAYQAERSYDVFRNGDSLERPYPSGGHDAMEIIAADDYRTVYFIPQDAIDSYAGTLTQNPTSN